MKHQLVFLLIRAQVPLEWLQPTTDDNADGNADKELGVAEAKSLEDVYKSHLENSSTFFRLF